MTSVSDMGILAAGFKQQQIMPACTDLMPRI
jgi:hypothetical protein